MIRLEESALIHAPISIRKSRAFANSPAGARESRRSPSALDEAGRQERQHQDRQDFPGNSFRPIEHDEDEPEDHERVLQSVVHGRDGNAGAERHRGQSTLVG